MAYQHYMNEDKVEIDENGDEIRSISENLASRINKGGEPPTAMAEQEKRMRREIANSNERRRMQSINNGFQSLRSLLPHHEGEKLSKAAILQQTAEYIYNLEQEKTRLLSQNCQLKRLLGQHEGGELPPKKRLKTELILPENADEGLGSMSPEIITVQVNDKDSVAFNQLKMTLDRERNVRLLLEDQVKQLEQQLEQQLYQNTNIQNMHQTQIQFLAEDQEVEEEIVETDEMASLQLVADDTLPVGHMQTVVCSPTASRCSSPETVIGAPTATVKGQKVILERVGLDRLPSVLEAAIKAEPKVEVERLPEDGVEDEEEEEIDEETLKAAAAAGRLYTPGQLSHTSRQNLETIVEAIRHLEGDHMFSDEQQQQQQQQQLPASGVSRKVRAVPQDAPLALTTRTVDGKQVIKTVKTVKTLGTLKAVNAVNTEQATLVEFSPTTLQQHQQSRPGVIVVKQAS